MPLLRGSLLKSEPAGSLRSLDETFALAYAMEREAATRYAELADEMRRQNKEDLAAVFAELAAAERNHVDSVTRWSQSRRGKPPDPALVRWEVATIVDPETATELMNSQLMTPYRALAMAVRNEERAFAFWSYLAAYAEDSEIKKAAEVMAREELEHVSTLRRERRRAYHKEHHTPLTDKTGEAAGSLREKSRATRVNARTLELRLAAQLRDLEQRLGGAFARRARELIDETLRMADEARDFGSFPDAIEQRDAQTIAEALAEAYLEGAENSSDETRAEVLQGSAGRAIARLAWLRSLA